MKKFYSLFVGFAALMSCLFLFQGCNQLDKIDTTNEFKSIKGDMYGQWTMKQIGIDTSLYADGSQIAWQDLDGTEYVSTEKIKSLQYEFKSDGYVTISGDVFDQTLPTTTTWDLTNSEKLIGVYQFGTIYYYKIVSFTPNRMELHFSFQSINSIGTPISTTRNYYVLTK